MLCFPSYLIAYIYPNPNPNPNLTLQDFVNLFYIARQKTWARRGAVTLTLTLTLGLGFAFTQTRSGRPKEIGVSNKTTIARSEIIQLKNPEYFNLL